MGQGGEDFVQRPATGDPGGYSFRGACIVEIRFGEGLGISQREEFQVSFVDNMFEDCGEERNKRD